MRVAGAELQRAATEADCAACGNAAATADTKRTRVNVGATSVVTSTAQCQNASPVLSNAAVASDIGAGGNVVAAVKYERTVVAHGTAAERTGRAAVADLQRARTDCC